MPFTASLIDTTVRYVHINACDGHGGRLLAVHGNALNSLYRHLRIQEDGCALGVRINLNVYRQRTTGN